VLTPPWKEKKCKPPGDPGLIPEYAPADIE